MELGFSSWKTRNSVTFCAVAFLMQREELLLVPGGLHNGQPVFGQPLLVEIPQVEEQLQVHVHDAGDVLRRVQCNGTSSRGELATRLNMSFVLRTSTQVSLLPPPCDEFTTSEPLRRATRVSPPGTISIFSP